MGKPTDGFSRNKLDVYQKVTDQITEALENGTVPWHKPWHAMEQLPTSIGSNKPYRGINPFLLSMVSRARGYESSFWGTYKAITGAGGQVRRGEKGSVVVFWKKLPPWQVEDQETGQTVSRSGIVLRYYSVFNASQADDLPASMFAKPDLMDHEPIASAESIVRGYFDRLDSPALKHGGNGAYYVPAMDYVQVPEMGAFETAEGYYSTIFHEATHSTGHASRLARKDLLDSHKFGDASYSREELVAEMGAAMLAGVAGIDQVTVPNSAAYVANWLKALRNDRRLVVTAAAQAQKAADLIRGVKFSDQD